MPDQNTSEQLKHSPLPWHVSTNGQTKESGGEPAFPGVHDSSGLPHGGDIVADCFGNSDRCNANSQFIVTACNSHYDLARQRDELLEVVKECEYALKQALEKNKIGWLQQSAHDACLSALMPNSHQFEAKHASHSSQKKRTSFGTLGSIGDAVEPFTTKPCEPRSVMDEEFARLKKYEQRMNWLHGSGLDSDGFEWGIYRVKWENGKPIEVLQTLSDFSDLDAEMERELATIKLTEPKASK